MVLLLKLIGVERKNFKKYKISLSPFFIGEPASIQNHNIKPDRQTGIKVSELQQADDGGRCCLDYPQVSLPKCEDADLSHQGGGGGTLVLESWWQDTLGLVVPTHRCMTVSKAKTIYYWM